VRVTRQRLVSLAFFSVLAASFVPIVQCQIDCIEPRPIIVNGIRGQVFDPSGVPIPNASALLLRAGKPTSKLRTDKQGRFQEASDAGTDAIQVSAPGFETLHFRIEDGSDVSRASPPKLIRIVLGLPGLNCAWATTSEKEFRREISNNNKRLQESVKNNAT
jgi:hypothetical protein